MSKDPEQTLPAPESGKPHRSIIEPAAPMAMGCPGIVGKELTEDLARVSAERDSLKGKLSLIEDGDWPGQVKALRTERDAMKAQLDLAAENAQKAGGICGLCLDSILGQPDRIVAAEAERDAAVKEKLAALAKVKALERRLHAVDAATAEVEAWASKARKGCKCDWCRTLHQVAEATARVRAALASEVPPQPTTPATPTDKEKTR